MARSSSSRIRAYWTRRSNMGTVTAGGGDGTGATGAADRVGISVWIIVPSGGRRAAGSRSGVLPGRGFGGGRGCGIDGAEQAGRDARDDLARGDVPGDDGTGSHQGT